MSDQRTKPVPIFEVNLDLPPGQRWDHIIPHFSQHFSLFDEFINVSLEQEFGYLHGLVNLLLILLSYFSFLFDTEFIQELKGISQQTGEYGVTFARLFQLNIAYDLIARCTSIATNSGDEVYHLRTMDWADYKDLLRSLTVEVHFTQNSNVVFKTTQWVGMVGTFTGAKITNDDRFGLSINFRKVGGAFSSLVGTICFLIDRKPLSFRIRKYLQYYPDASCVVIDVQRSWYSAPFYLLVSSTKHSTLLTRGFFDTKILKSNRIVQSNIDQNETFCDPQWAGDDSLLNNSIERRDLGYQLLHEIEEDLLTLKTQESKMKLYYKTILQKPPILSSNGDTIFTTMICLSPQVLYLSYTNWAE